MKEALTSRAFTSSSKLVAQIFEVIFMSSFIMTNMTMERSIFLDVIFWTHIEQVVKMFILIVSIFGICWLPYHSYFLYIYYDTNVIFSKYTQHVYLAFYWLAMSTAMVNPLIYYFMNARFRRYYKMAVCGWGCYEDTSDMNGKSPNIMRKNSHSYQSAMDTTLRRKRPNDAHMHQCASNGESPLLYRQGTVVSKVHIDTKFRESRYQKRTRWIGNGDEATKEYGHMTAEV